MIREQILQSCAQLAGHVLRANRGRPPARTVDRTAHDAALAEAEQVLERHRGELVAAEDPERLGPPRLGPRVFDEIEGHEIPKRILRRALESARPVHVLLVGPPAGGKTQLLLALAKQPRTRYVTGPTISSAGLFEYLLEHPECRVILIDEIDKAEESDLYTLYTLMESGRLTRLQHDAIEDEARIVWVMAAANSAAKLPEALRSRFIIRELPRYTRAQVEQIAEAVLVKREGLPRARAREIARAVAAQSTDPRDAVQVARLSRLGEPLDASLAAVRASKESGGGVS